jgi:hypothetical protein
MGLRGFAVVVALAALVPLTVSGQQRLKPAAAAKSGTVPRTADGRPDLQGFWTNDTFTPVERSPELGEKQFFTPAEAAAYFKQRLDRLEGQAKTDIHYDDALWQAETYEKQPNLRTSVIFDPPNGRLPPLTADAQRRTAARAEAARRMGTADSAQARSLAERCISWGNVGPPMLPPTYNANFQILQTADLVVLRHEMMHDTRLIYADGRPHANPGVRWLAGDARGRWEGNTLVVDTTNFTGQTNFRGSPQTTRQDISASDALHVIERFTPMDKDTITYQFTVEDPQTWTRPWSGELVLRRWTGPIYEYACHEGNYGLANILRAARVAEEGGK